MISNQVNNWGQAGYRKAYASMVDAGELEAFSFVRPVHLHSKSGPEAARAELMRIGSELRPDIVLVTTPKGFGHEPTWVSRFLRSCGDPFVIYWEGDAYHPWVKPINESMRAWLIEADVIFSVALQPQVSLLRKAGARDVRFVPHTYCPVVFEEAERLDPLDDINLSHDVIVVGNAFARLGLITRMPGAVGRASLVRRLQRRRHLSLAVYGTGWSGPGTLGPLEFRDQTKAVRRALISANWDHLPRHESYASDRLPISMLAGRVHITTAHKNMHWIPSGLRGLRFASSPAEVCRHVDELLASPKDEVLAAGAEAHRWVRGRLSDMQTARFMLGAVDKRFLKGLTEAPWQELANEWQR